MQNKHSIFLLLLSIPFFGWTQTTETKKPPITIVIHGGAGYADRAEMGTELENAYHISLKQALKTGYEILENGGSSLEAVEATLRFLEDDSLFNAGRGAVLTSEGKAELDASIMEGRSMKAGAVAGLTNVKNPITAARMVMERSPHVLLSGKGAEEFARSQGCEIVDPEYFITQKNLLDWKAIREAREKTKSTKGSGGAVPEKLPWKFGTVGCVALDRSGSLAAGTSTGGMSYKMHGRVGDSPIIGAGTYANNNTCAVSCTGHGEYFIRYAVSHDISALMEYKNLSVKEAVRQVVQEKLKTAGGTGGVIALDRNGNFTMEFNTEMMFRGFMREGELPRSWIFKD